MAERAPRSPNRVTSEKPTIGEINRSIQTRLSEVALLQERRILVLSEAQGQVKPYAGRYRDIRFSDTPAPYPPPTTRMGVVLDGLPADDYIVGELYPGNPEPLVDLVPKNAPHVTYAAHIESLTDVPISEVLGHQVHYPTQKEAEGWTAQNYLHDNIARN